MRKNQGTCAYISSSDFSSAPLKWLFLAVFNSLIVFPSLLLDFMYESCTINQDSLFLNVCCVGSMASPRNCPLAPVSIAQKLPFPASFNHMVIFQSSFSNYLANKLCRLVHTNLQTIFFWTSLNFLHIPPSKTPSCALSFLLPVLFPSPSCALSFTPSCALSFHCSWD